MVMDKMHINILHNILYILASYRSTRTQDMLDCRAVQACNRKFSDGGLKLYGTKKQRYGRRRATSLSGRYITTTTVKYAALRYSTQRTQR